MTTPSPTPAIAIRAATDEDRVALVRLAALDGARVPEGPLLLGLVDGEPRAVVPVDGGRPIADPWHPTADLVALLELRAARLRATEANVRAPRGALLRRLRAARRAAA